MESEFDSPYINHYPEGFDRYGYPITPLHNKFPGAVHHAAQEAFHLLYQFKEDQLAPYIYEALKQAKDGVRFLIRKCNERSHT